jgi:pyruvate/2-oxoglutarate dehydrogenase complex dihydrolipoamide dehydrogenase (E3) component
MRKVDVAIIGAGSGGLTVAYTARGFGKSVLMIDKNLPGGECTWAGCIPSKALINQANDIYTAGKYAEFVVNTELVMDKVRGIIENVYQGESIDVLKKDGIDFLQGAGRFVAANRLEVLGEEIEAKKIFICTGSSPMVPPIEGVDKIEILTNENFFLQKQLPKSILVLGGGAIGVELSQAMNRLGVQVQLIEMADQILPREDEKVVSLLRKELEREGLLIHTSAKAVKVYEEEGKVKLQLSTSTGMKVVEGDRILFALGRVPNVMHLDLEKAGIAYTKKGITVNPNMETTAKGVYAVGDVAGSYMFSHIANAQGIRAVQNAILPINKKMDYTNVSWCTFTSPELATAGLTEKEARERYGNSIRVYEYPYGNIDRAKTKEGSFGMVKLILKQNGKVLGCTILGERAGEIISEVQVVKTLGINFGKLANVIHPYPTYSEVLNKIGKKVLVDNLWNLPVVRWVKK